MAGSVNAEAGPSQRPRKRTRTESNDAETDGEGSGSQPSARIQKEIDKAIAKYRGWPARDIIINNESFGAVLQALKKEYNLQYAEGKFSEAESEIILKQVKIFRKRSRMTDEGLQRVLYGPRVKENKAVMRELVLDATTALNGTRPYPAVREFLQRKFREGAYQGSWAKSDIKALKASVAKYGNRWTEVAKDVGRTGEDCRKKWEHLELVERQLEDDLNEGKWSSEERSKLAAAIQAVREEQRIEGSLMNNTLRTNGFWKKVQERAQIRRSENQCMRKGIKLGIRDEDIPPTDSSRPPKKRRSRKQDNARFSPVDRLILIDRIIAQLKNTYAQESEINWSALSDERWAWAPHLLQRRWEYIKDHFGPDRKRGSFQSQCEAMRKQVLRKRNSWVKRQKRLKQGVPTSRSAEQPKQKRKQLDPSHPSHDIITDSESEDGEVRNEGPSRRRQEAQHGAGSGVDGQARGERSGSADRGSPAEGAATQTSVSKQNKAKTKSTGTVLGKRAARDSDSDGSGGSKEEAEEEADGDDESDSAAFGMQPLALGGARRGSGSRSAASVAAAATSDTDSESGGSKSGTNGRARSRSRSASVARNGEEGGSDKGSDSSSGSGSGSDSDSAASSSKAHRDKGKGKAAASGNGKGKGKGKAVADKDDGDASSNSDSDTSSDSDGGAGVTRKAQKGTKKMKKNADDGGPSKRAASVSSGDSSSSSESSDGEGNSTSSSSDDDSSSSDEDSSSSDDDDDDDDDDDEEEEEEAGTGVPTVHIDSDEEVDLISD
ncbi:hypothetical protein V8E36_009228 [Tilletia maclaganii]